MARILELVQIIMLRRRTRHRELKEAGCQRADVGPSQLGVRVISCVMLPYWQHILATMRAEHQRRLSFNERSEA